MSHENPCCCHHGHLTEQEVVVLELVAQGLPNEDIGRRLHLSGHTVAGHVGSAMRRLLARSRAELVARAYVSGLLVSDAWPPRTTGRRCYALDMLDGRGCSIPLREVSTGAVAASTVTITAAVATTEKRP